MAKNADPTPLTQEVALSAGTTGRHETFAPRYGWLKKGYDKCAEDPHVFLATDAIERLGVGKNMVRSIRFWCTLFRLLEEYDQPGALRPTRLGDSLLKTEGGWDPYLEDPASLWLLHWQAFRPPFLAVSWNLAFSYVMLPVFGVRELAEAIVKQTQSIERLSKVARGSFEKDASCLVRMYASSGTRERVELRSPFTNLGLVVAATEQEHAERFRFETGPKDTLPDYLFMAAVMDYVSDWHPRQKSLSLNEIVFGANSPGMAFRLSESDCGQRLDRVCRTLGGVVFTESSGIRQIQFTGDPKDYSWHCLQHYYGGKI